MTHRSLVARMRAVPLGEGFKLTRCGHEGWAGWCVYKRVEYDVVELICTEESWGPLKGMRGSLAEGQWSTGIEVTPLPAGTLAQVEMLEIHGQTAKAQALLGWKIPEPRMRKLTY